MEEKKREREGVNGWRGQRVENWSERELATKGRKRRFNSPHHLTVRCQSERELPDEAAERAGIYFVCGRRKRWN